MAGDPSDQSLADAFLRLQRLEGTRDGFLWRNRAGAAAMTMAVAIAGILAVSPPDLAAPASLDGRAEPTPSKPEPIAMKKSHLAYIPTVALAASTVHAAQIHVPGEQPTIQDAVTVAASGDEIVVGSGTYPGGIVIEGKVLTIRSAPGATVTIDGNGLTGFVVSGIPAPGLRLERIIVTDCEGSPFGGALRATASMIEVVECSFTNNRIVGGGGTQGGGAVYAEGCTIRVLGSNFTGNVVSLNSNGYPFGYGGALMLDNCTTTIDGCEFLENQVSTVVPGTSWSEARANGGAISARGSSGTIRNSIFSANRVDSTVTGYGPLASGHGFALSLASPSGQRFEVDSCRFDGNVGNTTSNNSAYQGAGSAVATVAFGIDSNDMALHSLRDCVFNGNRAMKEPSTNGAAIADVACIFHATVDIVNCRVSRSYASPITETLPGFGQWSASVGSIINPDVPATVLRDSAFCGLQCAVAGSEITLDNVTAVPDCCAGDLDGSLAVDGYDLGRLLGSWGPASAVEPADLNGDGIVDSADIAAVLASWGTCPG